MLQESWFQVVVFSASLQEFLLSGSHILFDDVQSGQEVQGK
jgi:hypothetical protein